MRFVILLIRVNVYHAIHNITWMVIIFVLLVIQQWEDVFNAHRTRNVLNANLDIIS